MRTDRERGYATPAAMLIAFAVAIVVAAITTRSVAELRLARAELANAQTEYALAAAQNAAMAAIATSSRPPPYRWVVPSLGDALDVVAEPERPKLSFAAAALLDDDALRRLGAPDPIAARDSLSRAAHVGSLVWVEDLETGAAWRACAASYVSQYGVALAPPVLQYGEPRSAQQPGLWRAGEVWRIEVTDKAGWRDARVVRFTGDGVHPAAVLGRRLSRVAKRTPTCEALIDGASGA